MKTLDTLKKLAEESKSSGQGKAYLKLESGDQYRLRFRQELSEDGKNFDEERGTALFVKVHTNPVNFKRKVACTAESAEFEFKCWACEQIVKNNKWRPRPHLLMNVAVLEDGTWVQKILDQGFSDSHVAATLIEYATAYGTVMDRTYKFSRTGSKMNDTRYQLIPLEEGQEPTELAEVELFDLTTNFKALSYEDQEEYLNSSDEEKDPASKWK